MMFLRVFFFDDNCLHITLVFSMDSLGIQRSFGASLSSKRVRLVSVWRCLAAVLRAL